MTTSNGRWTWAAALIIPVLGLGAVVLDPAGWVFWRAGTYSDVWISHAPVLSFIRQSLVTWHQIPLWNPLILSGMPLAADPLSGLWYLPHVVTWVGSSGLGFNLLFWGHLAFAAAGMIALLRSEGASGPASLLGGLIFAVTPKIVGHVALGHLTFVEAVCWTPWVLLAIRRAVDHALESRGRWWRFAFAGAGLGVSFLIDPRWCVPLGFVCAAYLGKCLAHSPQRPAVALRLAAGVPLMLGVAFGFVAPLALPLVELLHRSTRAALTAVEAAQMSLPPERLIGTLLLQPGGWPETQTYLGATVLVVLAAGSAVALRRSRFWWGVLLISLVLALGAATPVYAWLVRIVPGMGLVRVPARFFIVTALAAAMLAGHGYDRLVQARGNPASTRRVRLAALLIGSLALVLGFLSPALARASATSGVSPLAWAPAAGGILALATTAWVFLNSASSGWQRSGLLLIALVGLDLGWANLFTVEVRPAEAAALSVSCAAVEQGALFGEHRVFSPSYSLPQPAAAECGLELADGINPLQLTAYRDYMASVTGFDVGGYSVTLPPFEDGDPQADWGPAIDAAGIGLLNVDQIVSAYPLEGAELTPVGETGGNWIYRNEAARPRVWVVLDGTSTDAWQPVRAIDWSPNRIRVRASGPGQLVLSEVVYPGWHARVDGQLVSIEPYAGLLRSVALPAGEHELVFTFVPGLAFLGLAVAAVASITLFVLWVRR